MMFCQFSGVGGSVSGLTPTCGATSSTTFLMDPSCGRRSSVMRIARALTSGSMRQGRLGVGRGSRGRADGG